jgi:hypothetical protein
VTGDDADGFLAVARGAVRTAGGVDALGALGWWDLLDDLHDPVARTATVALFRAQGRELATTPALGVLMAEPYLAATGLVRGSVHATAARQSARGGWRTLVVGDHRSDHLVVDDPAGAVVIVDTADVELVPVAVPGRLVLHEVVVDGCRSAHAVDDDVARRARPRSWSLGRLACAAEILGAAEGAVALAADHATTRTQFGRPIATFQAVRHLLAWSTTDCAALQAVAEQAVALDDAAPPRHDEILKALAGRNGRRACERSLQVLGAIGFTAELDHHHFHSRVLALDAVLGSAASLSRDLGTALRTGRQDPAIARAYLGAHPGR